MFWLDDALCSDLYLDGVVTLVDAKYSMRHFENEEVDNQTHFDFIRQVALADVILLNKIDLIEGDGLKNCREAIESINSSCEILQTLRGIVDLNDVLDLHCYDSANVHFKFVDNPRNHNVDRNICTVTLEFDGVLKERDLDICLGELLWSSENFNCIMVLRIKGLVNLHEDSSCTYLLQAVYDMFDKFKLNYRYPKNRLIFIGKNLDKNKLEKLFTRNLLNLT